MSLFNTKPTSSIFGNNQKLNFNTQNSNSQPSTIFSNYNTQQPSTFSNYNNSQQPSTAFGNSKPSTTFGNSTSTQPSTAFGNSTSTQPSIQNNSEINPPNGYWVQHGFSLVNNTLYSHVSKYNFQNNSFHSIQLCDIDKTPIEDPYNTNGFITKINQKEWNIVENDIIETGILNQCQGKLTLIDNQWSFEGTWWRVDRSDYGYFRSVYIPYFSI